MLTDTLQPLAQLRSRCCEPLSEALLAVSSDAGPVDSWIENLECLYLGDDSDDRRRDGDFRVPSKRRRGPSGPLASVPPSPGILKRRNLDPLTGTDASRNYVAVSYTWEPSTDESPAIGRYLIETRDRQPRVRNSEVRDNVWDRVLRFAKYVGCPNIWVDRECIDQENDAEKQAAMQNMHLVYSLSRNPVALLTCTITTEQQLVLLADLLNGNVQEQKRAATLDLLQHITSSSWWNRAWTFQEDYRASSRIKLLIPHTPDLQVCKRKLRSSKGASLFGALPGEVILKSADFKRHATRFCIAYQKNGGPQSTCKSILETSGRYTELLKERAVSPRTPSITRSMSPTIFTDVCKRGITTESDRLAIIANCCGYETRLSNDALARRDSLSLLLLALFLINGEIMENDPARNFGSLADSVLTYITKQSLQSFRPVVHQELTFIKHCRFIQPKLTAGGISTKGHLWTLGRTIRRDAITDPDLTAAQVLQILSIDLQDGLFGKDLDTLAEQIDEWAGSSQATNASFSSQHPSSQWRDWMANQVAQCLRDGKSLRLGTLVDAIELQNGRRSTKRQPSAIFTAEEDSRSLLDPDTRPAEHVFTSFRWARNESDTLDKHVSLRVRLAPGEDASPSPKKSSVPIHDTVDEALSVVPPRLYIDRWVNGLCFFAGLATQEVVFPLPSALTE
ncbi:heterokaryon incompatibility protein-domain-containing protein [Microdochium trichocladiopsis]|uniref:Heterokaryon incompatibility protein-domain-containing protein n=1 Tax=Microdochium trichocladiopsis TaxID=1682393 RepID=A0A9P8Y8U4_9PEZI|nr:heterokaryon incompatibility protein-domain-containing protein [Microdochium trichocladiopsis]KAH7035104.1 heterokaryon incompatibility protein-domain-containing protein [Microdochium trichocladiopsis]